MEIIDIVNKRMANKAANNRKLSIYAGSIFILAGVVWLLHNTGVICECVFNVVFCWQMLLVVIGGFLLCQRNWVFGGVLAAFGLLFLVAEILHVDISFKDIVLPILLITGGIAVLFYRKQ